jgi:hypothetical protein
LSAVIITTEHAGAASVELKVGDASCKIDQRVNGQTRVTARILHYTECQNAAPWRWTRGSKELEAVENAIKGSGLAKGTADKTSRYECEFNSKNSQVLNCDLPYIISFARPYVQAELACVTRKADVTAKCEAFVGCRKVIVDALSLNDTREVQTNITSGGTIEPERPGYRSFSEFTSPEAAIARFDTFASANGCQK